MANFGEEITYWYLRLNGFFPIRNFVIHRTAETEYPSDIDILAIRPPYVYEKVGGQSGDWDENLAFLDFTKVIGLIVEVKTGELEEDKLFRPRYVEYAVGRLGLVEQTNDIEEIAAELENVAVLKDKGDYQIGKLLITEYEPKKEGNYYCMFLEKLTEFLQWRIRKYPKEKYGDKLFFPSDYLQNLINDTYKALQKNRT